jgi:alkylation response protein AidB-like acyl-CoA dehydrogenase
MHLISDTDTDGFRSELRAFLDSHAPPEAAHPTQISDDGIPEWARRWQADLFDHGWLVPQNPRGLGGREASVEETLVYLEEMAGRGLYRSAAYPGYGIVAPTLARFGSESLQPFVVPAMRADHIWCIGMSEPDAGSDLGNIRTRAQMSDDGYVLSGTKVWTSYAMWADRCLCFGRTSDERRGLSVFVVDMRSPGIEVHPIKQATGAGDFALVHLDEVPVRGDALVGRVGDGWAIAMAMLGAERRGLWLEWLSGLVRALRALPSVAEQPGHAAAEQIGSAYERVAGLICLGMRSVASGEEGLGWSSLLKLAVSETAVELVDLGVKISYPDSLDHDKLPGLDHLLNTLADTVGGGTGEIQRNAVASEVLGLPRAAR